MLSMITVTFIHIYRLYDIYTIMSTPSLIICDIANDASQDVIEQMRIIREHKAAEAAILIAAAEANEAADAAAEKLFHQQLMTAKITWEAELLIHNETGILDIPIVGGGKYTIHTAISCLAKEKIDTTVRFSDTAFTTDIISIAKCLVNKILARHAPYFARNKSGFAEGNSFSDLTTISTSITLSDETAVRFIINNSCPICIDRDAIGGNLPSCGVYNPIGLHTRHTYTHDFQKATSLYMTTPQYVFGKWSRLDMERAIFRYMWFRKYATIRLMKEQQESAKKVAEEQLKKQAETDARIKAKKDTMTAMRDKFIAHTALVAKGGSCNLTTHLADDVTNTIYVSYYRLIPTATEKTLVVSTYDPHSFTLHNPCTQPSSYNTPTSWNSHFTLGLIPFLPQCPVCSKQSVINMSYNTAGISTPTNIVQSVSCPTHYMWKPSTNLHYKLTLHVNPTIYDTYGRVISPYMSPYYIETLWDPLDPDGSIAEKTRKDAEIASIVHQIVTLQAKLDILIC
jgi:hypothetical protein